MPKHDDLITMEEIAASLAKAHIGNRTKWEGERFALRKEDKTAIAAVTPLCSDDDRNWSWFAAIERGLDGYLDCREVSLPDIRQRLKILAGTSAALDNQILKMLEAAYNPLHSEALRESWKRANITFAVSMLTQAASVALTAVDNNGGKYPDLAAERLARLLGCLWVVYSGEVPIDSRDERGEQLGAFADHVRKVLLALPDDVRPPEDTFISKAAQFGKAHALELKQREPQGTNSKS